jgi:hypothetical protein
MATTKKKTAGRNVYGNNFEISTVDEAGFYLAEMVDIEAEVAAQMQRAVEIKKAVTEFAVKKKIDVIQLDSQYFRQINRSSRFWVATDADMPSLPKGCEVPESDYRRSHGQARQAHPLWNLIPSAYRQRPHQRRCFRGMAD